MSVMGDGAPSSTARFYEESLAIGRHGVLLLVRARQRAAGDANREQGRRSSGFQRLAIGRQLHRSGHHLAVQRHVEDLLTVLVPARLCAAITGNLELPARSWKGLDVDLELARFVRLIRDPLAVGEELTFAFFKRSLQGGERLFVARDWQNSQGVYRRRMGVA